MPADALVTLGLLAVLAVVFYGPWQDVCTDFTRQLIFERHDRLFDLAAEGKLDFDSEEYRTLRAFLEGAIRFAHELTWPQIIVALITYKERSIASGTLTPDRAAAKIEDPEIRRFALRQINEATGALFIMATMKSAFLAPAAGLLVLAAFCTRRINLILAPARHKGQVVDRVLTTIERGSIAHV